MPGLLLDPAAISARAAVAGRAVRSRASPRRSRATWTACSRRRCTWPSARPASRAPAAGAPCTAPSSPSTRSRRTASAASACGRDYAGDAHTSSWAVPLPAVARGARGARRGVARGARPAGVRRVRRPRAGGGRRRVSPAAQPGQRARPVPPVLQHLPRVAVAAVAVRRARPARIRGRPDGARRAGARRARRAEPRAHRVVPGGALQPSGVERGRRAWRRRAC
jgi:hypothetical protein